MLALRISSSWDVDTLLMMFMGKLILRETGICFTAVPARIGGAFVEKRIITFYHGKTSVKREEIVIPELLWH